MAIPNRLAQTLLFFVSATVLSGCATARVAEGPGITALTMRGQAPVVEVAMVQDGRTQTHAGTIGAAGVNVPTSVKKTFHNYLVNTIYDNFMVNVKPVTKGADKAALGMLVSSKIESVTIFSIDAILQPVDVRCGLQLIVRDMNGSKVYERSYDGFYQERIGMAWDTDGVTGNLVEEAIRDMMKKVAADEALKKVLQQG